jgi:predicted RNase H-like HicB family nuclease
MAKRSAETKAPRRAHHSREGDQAVLQALAQAESQAVALHRQVEAARRAAERARPRPRVKVVLYPDGAGGFTAVVPALPGCVAEGETREEALASLREAVEGYLLCTPGAFEREEDAIEEEIEL